ncbi:collagenase-like [Eurosta solidaginis]|uniref:collagenase-like n=1 Tax=Eurosta solidaginis TaxID=178769 RepID=UPI0035315F7F
MKFLIAWSLLICIASAFEIRGTRNIQRERFGSMVQKAVVSSRITNAQTAAVNQFRYQAGLSIYDGEKYKLCGGSLISKEWVLTAAHCTLTAVVVFVYLGSITCYDPSTRLRVDRCNIIVHSEYNTETAINDIALINIPNVRRSAAIYPVSLPRRASRYSAYVDETAVASGWGRTSDRSTSNSPILQYASFKVISNEVCAGIYGSSFIDNGKICTATVNRIGVCNGDSGGPLVLESSNIQIGILSFYSDYGCEADIPAGYTRVTSYLDWIEAYTNLII